jgi:hypothetical protein
MDWNSKTLIHPISSAIAAATDNSQLNRKATNMNHIRNKHRPTLVVLGFRSPTSGVQFTSTLGTIRTSNVCIYSLQEFLEQLKLGNNNPTMRNRAVSESSQLTLITDLLESYKSHSVDNANHGISRHS